MDCLASPLSAASGDASCPRCGKSFSCGAASPAPCACSRLQLTEALRAELRTRYTGCLCPACLLALGAEPAPGSAQAGRSSPGPAGR